MDGSKLAAAGIALTPVREAVARNLRAWKRAA
jgi:hypothetical protein